MTSITFAHEADRRLRVAFLGTSGHAFRNYLPSLAYAAVELVALWDSKAERAEAFARQFGAARWYTDVDELLTETAPDAVLIGVEGFDGDEPASTHLMARCLEAGCHVWADKPVAAHVATVENLIAVRDRVGRLAAVGVKTMHNPAYVKAREIVRDEAFGRPTSFSCRYPLHVPSQPGMQLSDKPVRSCLNHIWHPLGVALLTVGAVDTIECRPAPAGGGAVATATFCDGTVGAFHFAADQAETSPLERVEIVGEGTNVVVDNAAHVTWYRPGRVGEYGRTPSFTTPNDIAPLTWYPELSLGQLYNNNNFMQGYAQSIITFVDAALFDRPLTAGTLEDAAEILRVFEALVGFSDGVVPRNSDSAAHTSPSSDRK